jgi:phosphoribosylcarboxyaminoimidazole (NCAIR) mutase
MDLIQQMNELRRSLARRTGAVSVAVPMATAHNPIVGSTTVTASTMVVPAATVGVDRGDNAGYLATQILALKNPLFEAALKQNKLDQIERVKAQDRDVNGGQ